MSMVAKFPVLSPGFWFCIIKGYTIPSVSIKVWYEILVNNL